ncbi:unnamed protein product [Darwinula stevensoni]|uniref:Major facilitator superfamily (MFS) profile domain-containing protein n=1 Tax=Darwinula stevensoni TaxID=69355 RepID=A0A7R9FSP4_9CRUS|nr:unnamed protein product [Darwinula stevensoni]CAG0903045.1 unnamed protein product [Darwinula stevensoni]
MAIKFPFHPGHIASWLAEKEDEARNFDELVNKFTRSGVEIEDASIAFHLSETRPTACFFYKGLDDVDLYLEGLNSFLNGNEPDLPLEPSPSIYRNHDEVLQLFDYQRIFLHYAWEQGSPFTFIAAEATGFDGPCLIRLSRGIDGMSLFVPPGEPRDQRVSADGAAAEVRWTSAPSGSDSSTSRSELRAIRRVAGNVPPPRRRSRGFLGWFQGRNTSSRSVSIDSDGSMLMVAASSDLGIGPPSPTVSWDFRTVEDENQTSSTRYRGSPSHPSPAQEANENPKPSHGIRELPKRKVMEDAAHRLAKYEVGRRRPNSGPTKVLMVVGATGAVKWLDNFRLRLVSDEANGRSQTKSQTKWITAYVLHGEKGFALPYALTVVDTPGFGDTEGIRADRELQEQIRVFFSKGGDEGVDQLDGICFVVEAPSVRLTPTQVYIFNSVPSVFGSDVRDRIFALVTSADNQSPPVLAALREAGIPYKDYIKFNNSALFASTDRSDALSEAFWGIGIASFKTFFRKIRDTKPRKKECDVIDASTGRCLVCPLRCDWKEHVNGKYRFELTEEEETKTSDDAKAKHEQVTGKRLNAEGIVIALAREFNEEMAKFLILTQRAHACLRRLDEIALKPNPIGIADYIDILIQAEKQEARPDLRQRIKYLEDARAMAELALAMKDEFDPFQEYVKEFEEGRIGFSSKQGQLGLCDSFIEEALQLLHGHRTLDRWLFNSLFHPARTVSWLAEEEDEARNFGELVNKFTLSSTELYSVGLDPPDPNNFEIPPGNTGGFIDKLLETRDARPLLPYAFTPYVLFLAMDLGENPVKASEAVGEQVDQNEEEVHGCFEFFRKSSWRARGLILYGGLVTLFGFASFSIVVPFYPAVAERKGASSTTIGLIVGVFSLVAFLLGPIVGKYLPHIGLNRAICGGTLLSGVACISFG